MDTHPAVQRYLAGAQQRRPFDALDWQRHGDRPPSAQQALDRLTQLAGEALDVPAVCVSLMDSDRRLRTSSYGLPVPTALLLSHAFLRPVVASRGPLVVADALCDPLRARYPAVRDGTVRAYVGVPLHTEEGLPVGFLLAMDRRPRRWLASQLDLLRDAIAKGRPKALDSVRMTPRERDVINLIAEGLSNKEIAGRLHIATHTVKSHVRNVMEKLMLHTRLQIAAYAHQGKAS